MGKRGDMFVWYVEYIECECAGWDEWTNLETRGYFVTCTKDIGEIEDGESGPWKYIKIQYAEFLGKCRVCKEVK